MALKYTLKKLQIMDGGQEIATVRGLSTNDISALVLQNRDAMTQIFNAFTGRDPESITDAETMGLAQDMFEHAPLVVAQIIAVATDAYDGYEPVDGEPSPIDLILTMPLGLQMEMLEKTGRLTFTSDFGPKELGALVAKLLSGSQSARRQ